MADKNDPRDPSNPGGGGGGGGGQPPRIQLQLDEDVALGVYTNLVIVNHTENEFVLDFAFIPPGAPGAKVRTRVISSPRHTKRLVQALQKNIEKYEERYGEVDPGPEEPNVH